MKTTSTKSSAEVKKVKRISMAKGTEELRFEPYTLKSGETLGSLRVFYKDKQGEMQPGRQGLTLRKEEFPAFVACLKALYARLPDTADEDESTDDDT